MIFSFAAFLPLFPRVLVRREIFLATPRGRNFREREHYNRRRFSYYLMLTCAVVWSVLVIIYFVNMVIHHMIPDGHFLRFKSFAMLCDTAWDVLAKVVYTKIIVEGHQAIFASDLRTVRQLNELKQLITVLWDSTSDAIVISTNREHCSGKSAASVTMLSPSFVTLVGAELPAVKCDENTTSYSSVALVLELEDLNGDDEPTVSSAYYIDTSPTYDLYPEEYEKAILMVEDLSSHVVQEAAKIVAGSWAELHNQKGGKKQQQQQQLQTFRVEHMQRKSVWCETVVSHHTEGTMVAVVRDVTERYLRFEAEQRAQRDMHAANRFTRHEVKNGLLSSMELCNNLQQARDELKQLFVKSKDVKIIADQCLAFVDENLSRCIGELDHNLHDVLDTILAEVMAREVVYEVYQPRLEAVDLQKVLTCSGHTAIDHDRFPIEVTGGSVPILQLDTQLIGYIHRNAVSNACKYGKQGGQVITTISFNGDTHELRVEVTNDPGPDHAELIALGKSASEFVFAQGCRLQTRMKGGSISEKRDSSGDGAWIMQKCAKIMQGSCHIKFESRGTRFTCQCPH